MTVWTKFDLANKMVPKSPGLYLWKTGKRTGLFEVLSNKPIYLPYDIRYYISQNKEVYLVFDDDFPPQNLDGTYEIEWWVEQ